MSEGVGETGETFFAMRSLLILVSDSAGFLHQLLTVERPEPWQRAAIVREWQRLRSTALDFNHCDGYDYDRWWKQIRHYDAADEAAELERIRHFATLYPWADDEADQGEEDERDTPPPASGATRSEWASRTEGVQTGKRPDGCDSRPTRASMGRLENQGL